MRKKTQPTSEFSFRATLENWAEGMNYCAIAVPAKITKAIGTKAAVLVMATLNKSDPFKVSLFPVGGGRHFIRVRAKIRKDFKLEEGDRVTVRFTILDRADVDIPIDLAKALRAESMIDEFNLLTPGRKNYVVRRIDDAVRPETRAKRVAEAIAEALRASEERAARNQGKGN